MVSLVGAQDSFDKVTRWARFVGRVLYRRHAHEEGAGKPTLSYATGCCRMKIHKEEILWNAQGQTATTLRL